MISYCCATEIFRAMIAGPMTHTYSNADVLTSARMAAGMTLRARRPYPHISAG
jgi:hypothetical protein